MDNDERMNTFRRFFASSRYERLKIQKTLVRSSFVPELSDAVPEMEMVHRRDFAKVMNALRKSKYFSEFVAAAKEEDSALQQIIEAYDKRMTNIR